MTPPPGAPDPTGDSTDDPTDDLAGDLAGDLPGLSVDLHDGVAVVLIDHPPINLLDVSLLMAFDEIGRRLADHDDVRVVVVESADPDFWIAHADVEMILSLPRDQGREVGAELHVFHQMVERFRTMPKVTIAKITGAVRGGGAELAASMDMRFAAEHAVLGQPETALGILPGGSGTERLGQLVGRSRALEIVLGGADVDAPTAAAWGWINRALPAEEIDAFVDDLAHRIASFPPAAIAEAKASVLRGLPDPMPTLLAEAAAFDRTLGDPEAIRRMQRFLALGGQTREVEVDLPSLFDRLSE